MEQYWELVCDTERILSLLAAGGIFGFFVRPFLNSGKTAGITGAVYALVMIVLYLLPVELHYPGIPAFGGVLGVMCLSDRRNRAQKLVLVILMYLMKWIAQGAALIPWKLLYGLLITRPSMAEKETLQFVNYVFLEILLFVLQGLFLYLLAVGIHKLYINKKENIEKKELLLLLCILFTIVTGYFSFTYFSDLYEADMGQYIWNVHEEYTLLELLYQLFSCLVLFTIMTVYQRMKEKQKQEKENAVLAEQLENMKSHIGEIEKLYGDIRAMKHEMGNHITVLENLLLQDQKEETEKYFSQLKQQWQESTTEMKTGNPVTDVILLQKQKEAEEKGIRFQCDFFYPVETRLEAFDVSIILHNALTNAIEGTQDCADPYITLVSYRKKNAYLIEVENRSLKKAVISEETGLPETTKEDKTAHGIGLAGIRRIARKYYGAMELEQQADHFRLTILLMVE